MKKKMIALSLGFMFLIVGFLSTNNQVMAQPQGPEGVCRFDPNFGACINTNQELTYCPCYECNTCDDDGDAPE